MSAPRYPANTIAEMAEIPEEALPRFLAELPDILRHIRQIEDSIPDLARKAHERAPWPIRLLSRRFFERLMRHAVLKGAKYWTDDDKGQITVSAQVGRDDPPFWSQTEKLR